MNYQQDLQDKGVFILQYDINESLCISRQQYFSELDDETRLVELRLHEYFRSRGYLVIDKRNDEESRLKDIDFEIQYIGRQNLNIEVKADKQMYKTGNILVELRHLRPYKGKTNGWYKYCDADIICYQDTVQDIGYMLNWKKMKPELHGNYRLIGFDNPHDYGTYTNAYLVPIEEAKKQGFIIEEYRL